MDLVAFAGKSRKLKSSNLRKGNNNGSNKTSVASINTSLWKLSDFVTSKVFTYLVLDDLYDCTGVCHFFYNAVANAVNFMISKRLFSVAFFAPSRVSCNLARVRVGLVGVHISMAKRKSTFREKQQKSASNSKPVFALTNVNSTRCFQPVHNTLPTLGQRYNNKIRKKGKCNQNQNSLRAPKVKMRMHGPKLKKQNRRPPLANHSNKENQVQPAAQVPSPPLSMSRVHFISKPKKLPSPPKVKSNNRDNGLKSSSIRPRSSHRRVVKRSKKTTLVHFFRMLPGNYYKRWLHFKSTGMSLTKYIKQNKGSGISNAPKN